jgi:hypothetical protein
VRFLVNEPYAPGIAKTVIRNELEQRGAPICIARIKSVLCCGRFDFAAVAPADTRRESQGAIAKTHHDLALHAVVCTSPSRKQVSALATRSHEIDRVWCLDGDDSTNCRTAVQG